MWRALESIFNYQLLQFYRSMASNFRIFKWSTTSGLCTNWKCIRHCTHLWLYLSIDQDVLVCPKSSLIFGSRLLFDSVYWVWCHVTRLTPVVHMQKKFLKKRERYAHAHPFAWYGWWGLVRSARIVKRCALTPLWHYSEIWICLPPLCRLPNSCCLRPESPSYHTHTHGEQASIPAARFRHELWLADEHSCWFQICWLLILPSATRPQLSFLCLFG